jgi:hypothetical protein
MMKAIEFPRLKARVLLVLAATVVAILALSALSNSPGPLGTDEADAAVAYRQIKGTVLRSDTGRAVPYANVSLEWWNGSGWVYWKSAQSNSYGQYYFNNNPTSYFYRVCGSKIISGNSYAGCGAYFFLSPNVSMPANSTVKLSKQSPFQLRSAKASSDAGQKPQPEAAGKQNSPGAR